MRNVALVPLLVLVLQPAAAAAPLLLLDITYAGLWRRGVESGGLTELATTLILTDTGLAVTSLRYAFAPIDEPAVSGRISMNFPLEIEGRDQASGEAFHYRYNTSTQTATVVPEPATGTLLAIGLAAAGWRKRVSPQSSARARVVVVVRTRGDVDVHAGPVTLSPDTASED